jgi:hypothetical protein
MPSPHFAAGRCFPLSHHFARHASCNLIWGVCVRPSPAPCQMTAPADSAHRGGAPMARKTARSRDSAADDPETIRKHMTQTRAAMTSKLDAIQSRLTGRPVRVTEERETVAANKTGTSSKKSAASRARAGSKSHAGKKSARKRAGTRTGSAVARKSKGASSSKKKTSAGKRARAPSKVGRTKEVLNEVLAGAAAGAVKAAAQVVAAHADQVLEEQKAPGGTPAPVPPAQTPVEPQHHQAAPAPRPPVM